jgi:hypothetical protein
MTISYNGNGYTGGTLPIDATDYSFGATAIIKVPGTLSRAGYEFTRYATASDGTGVIYQGLDTLDITGDITLYAQWVKGVSLPKDVNGWTTFVPQANSRLIYVSTSGNNGTAQYYAPSNINIGSDPFNPTGTILPYATFAAADAVARSGYADYILFKCGDKFIDVSINNPKSGADDNNFFVYGSYGSNSNPTRPIVEPVGSDTALINFISSTSLHDVAFVGIDFYAESRDPTSINYNINFGEPGGIYLWTDIGIFRQILFEDVTFRYFSTNISQLYGTATGSISELVIRRSSILNQYVDGSHSQGLYASHVTGIIIDECVFDHNGWYAQDPSTPGTATIFNHNTYFTNCRNVLFRHNIFLRSSSIHNKFTANEGVADEAGPITLFENLYIDGELGFDIGGNIDYPYRYLSTSISRNIFTEIGRSQPTNRTLAWTMHAYDWDGGALTQNLNLFNSNASVVNVYGFQFGGGSRNVRIDSNIFYNLSKLGQWSTAFSVDNVATKSGIIFSRNLLQQPNQSEIMINFTNASDLPAFVFKENRYLSTNISPFIVGANSYNLSQWSALTGDNSTEVPVTFSDATRSIETYQTSIGGVSTIDAFITACRSRTKANWVNNYSTTTVLNWIAAGYVSGYIPPEPPVTVLLVMVLK